MTVNEFQSPLGPIRPCMLERAMTRQLRLYPRSARSRASASHRRGEATRSIHSRVRARRRRRRERQARGRGQRVGGGRGRRPCVWGMRRRTEHKRPCAQLFHDAAGSSPATSSSSLVFPRSPRLLRAGSTHNCPVGARSAAGYSSRHSLHGHFPGDQDFLKYEQGRQRWRRVWRTRRRYVCIFTHYTYFSQGILRAWRRTGWVPAAGYGSTGHGSGYVYCDLMCLEF